MSNIFTLKKFLGSYLIRYSKLLNENENSFQY